ncbi:hypothetical protein GCM10022409_45480 [Hymenobacter glaciei]|uniref:Uncharacterized protein n=1 Tax=Hymenobacter glaciei TaxID=877209 RepID=A0ABP7UUQ8_9BACT
MQFVDFRRAFLNEAEVEVLGVHYFRGAVEIAWREHQAGLVAQDDEGWVRLGDGLQSKISFEKGLGLRYVADG